MDTKLTTLAPFFQDPLNQFSLRELARMLHSNHTTVRQHLRLLVKEGLLTAKKEGVYTFYQLIFSKKLQNLKLFYNLERLRQSGLVEDLEKAFDFPVIILFGSFASATDDKTSDIDIALISDVSRDFSLGKYEQLLHRPINLRKFSGKLWASVIKENPSLVNSMCNGVVLSGELEVV